MVLVQVLTFVELTPEVETRHSNLLGPWSIALLKPSTKRHVEALLCFPIMLCIRERSPPDRQEPLLVFSAFAS